MRTLIFTLLLLAILVSAGTGVAILLNARLGRLVRCAGALLIGAVGVAVALIVVIVGDAP